MTIDIDKISNILDCNDTSVNKSITGKLKLLYPKIDFNNIDNNLLENIIQNIVINDNKNIDLIKNEMVTNLTNLTNLSNITDSNNKSNISDNDLKENINKQKNKLDLEIIKQNILMANEFISEMLISSNLIYLKGKLNGINARILIDTGATSCIIFKSVVDKYGLNYLIDTSSKVMVQCAHGMKSTLGTICFIEIELEINKDKYISIPISLEVIDDSETINASKIINEYYDKITKIIGLNIDNIDNMKKISNTHEFEIILGMSFLKSYHASIDFSTMILTLNKNIKIKFN